MLFTQTIVSKNAIVFKAIFNVNMFYYVNLDLENLTHWLNANRISTNLKKTELLIFKHQRKKVDNPIKIKLHYKRFYHSNSAKYLGIKINENFNWKQHIHDISIKLNRVTTLLSIITKYVNKHTLRTIYFPIFDFHMNYVNLIWSQKPRVELSSYKRKP